MIKKRFILVSSLFLIGSLMMDCAAQTKKLKTIVVDAGHGGSDPGAVGNYENSLKSKEKDITLAISLKLVDELKKQMPDLNIVPTRTTDVFDNVNEKSRIANEAKGDLFICIHADSGPVKRGRRLIGTRTVTRNKVTYTGKGKKRKKIVTPYDVEIPEYETFILPGTANGSTVYIFNPKNIGTKIKSVKNGDEEFDVQFESEDSSHVSVDYSTPVGKQLANAYVKLYQEKSDLLGTFVNDEIIDLGRTAHGVKQRGTGIKVLEATKMPAILIETGYVNNPDDEKYLNSEEGQQEMAVAITKAVIKYRSQIDAKK